MKREVTPEIVCNAVAAEFSITPEALCAKPPKRSSRSLAEAKQVAAYLMRLHTDMPLRHISATLNFDDKQYITYCVKRTILNMGTEPDTNIKVCRIELKMFEELNLAA